MLAPTRKHPTETFTVTCPVDMQASVMAFLRDKGCTVQGSVAPEEVLDMSPAAILRGMRYREDITQAELSRRTGIPQRHISEMENSRRPIGKQNARKLAEALNCPPARFLAA